MLAKLGNWWENAQASLWFVPGLMVLGAAILSAALLYVDDTLAPNLNATLPWLFGGTAGAARSLLSTVAGSLITVISIAFSITIVALQQASTQYSPRVLRNFTKDRGNQIVLGSYLGTFTYALLVMRRVREPAEGQAGFVPALSITMAILLALASVGLLVYFIDHISKSLQVSMILASIRQEVEEEIAHLFPSSFGQASTEPPSRESLIRQLSRERRGRETSVSTTKAGYLRRIDEGQLDEATGGDRLVLVYPQIGDYLMRDEPVARIWSEEPPSQERQERISGAFVLDRERSIYQDPLFGVRQMVDIAVKALSPGINDPTTAEQSLSNLGDVVARLMDREFPSPLRRTEAGTGYLFNRPGFPDYVDASFSQIRRAADRNVHVTLYLLSLLKALGERAPDPERIAPLRRQVEEVLDALGSSGFTRGDRETVRIRAQETIEALQEREGSLRRAA